MSLTDGPPGNGTVGPCGRFLVWPQSGWQQRGKVRVLIVGANGLIGSAAATRLAAEGHNVIGVGRRTAEPGLADTTYFRVDLARAIDPQEWTEQLRGIDAVPNCTGVRQDAARGKPGIR